MADEVRIGSGSILLVPDARTFRRKAEEDLKKIELMHRVTLTPHLERANYRRRANELLAGVQLRQQVHLDPRLSAGFRQDARGRVDAALRGLSHTVILNLTVGTELATRQMAVWRREQEARPVRIKVVTEHVGGTRTGSTARTPEREADRFGSRFAQSASGLHIPASIDLTGAERQLRDFGDRAFGRGKGGSAQPPRDPRFRDLFRIRPHIEDADLRNNPRIRDQLRRASYELNDSFRLRIQPNIAGVQARLPLGGLGVAAIPEMISQIGGLTAALTQLGQAALIIPGSLASIGAVVATGAVGLHGMVAAYKALSTAEKDSTQTASAQMSTRREMVDAVNDEARAHRALSDAVTNEQRRQRDLQLQLKGAKLTEAEAVLAIQDAAAEIREGHFANQREYDHALLRYEESKQNLLEVRNRNADLAQDVAKNERTGVQGSDAVLSATQALTQASERVAEATQKMAEGGSALGSATAKAKDAMDKLSPSAKEFVQTLFDMREPLRQFSLGIQENLTTGLAGSFSTLFNSPAIQTNLKQGMQSLATQMNLLTKSTFAQLGSPQTGGFITRIFGNTTEETARFRNEVLNPLITGLGTLTAAGTDALPRITTAMGELATRFSNFITKADSDGSLKRWIDQGLDAFTQLGRIVGNLMSSLEGISKAFGGDFLTNVDHATSKLADFLNSARGQADLRNFISETTTAFQTWKPILLELPDIAHAAFNGAKTAVAAFLPVIQLLVDVLKACPGLISTIATAFVAFRTISPVVTGVIAVMNGLSGVLTNVGTKFGTTKAEAALAAKGVDEAFAGTANEGGAIHRTSKAVAGLGGALSSTGPLAVALATGALVLMQRWINQEEDAITTTQNLKRETEDLASTLDRVTGLSTQATREELGKRFANYQPASAQGIGKDQNVLAAASALGLGGKQGQDLVTAALPGGGAQYEDIMKNLRDRVRPQVQDFIKNQGIVLSDVGLSENDMVDAFLGVPAALDKINQRKQLGLKTIDLGVLAEQVKRGGGQGLQAAIVGQALNEQRFASTGAGQQFATAHAAAQPNIGLATNVFGADAKPGVFQGQYEIASNVAPTDPAIKAILDDQSARVTVTENPPGAGGPKYTYTIGNADTARKYISGLPAYQAGGETKAGLAVLHEPEFVVSDKGVNKYGNEFLHSVNEGNMDLSKLPHFDRGGPYQLDPFHPAIPEPPVPTSPPTPQRGNTAGAVAPPGGPAQPAPPAAATLPPDLIHNAPGPLPDGAGDAPAITDNSFTLGGRIANTLGGGDVGGTAGGGDVGSNFLQSFLGHGGGGPADFGAIAARFGQIALSGVLGFFGINPQYLNDIDQVLNFGLGKLAGGGLDPDAAANIQQNLVGYDKDGKPMYFLPAGQAGTDLPDASGTGTGGAPQIPTIPNVGGAGSGSPGAAPGGATIGPNPASHASYGGQSPPDVTPESLKSKGFAPLYSWNDSDKAARSPAWINQLAGQFGLVASTYNEGDTLHHGGYAWDFNDPDSPGKDSPKLDAFAEFIQTHLGGQTLQLIHASPSGQRWGIAAGTPVGPGTASPNYYSRDWGGHFDHVHWATDAPVVFASTSGALASAPGAKPGQFTRSWWESSPLGWGSPAAPGGPAPLDTGGSGGGSGGVGGGSGRGGAPRGLLYVPGKGIVGSIGGSNDLFGGGGGGGSDTGASGNARPPDLTGLKATAYQLYRAMGMPADEWNDFDQLEQHEAGWSPTAQNPSSTAFGLGQFLDSTWASVGGTKTSDPKLQLQYMFQYLKARYHGSPREAWRMWQSRTPHWYDWGGLLPDGLTTILNATGQDELVMNQQQMADTAAAIPHPDDVANLQATAASYIRPTGDDAVTPVDPNRSGAGIPPEIMQQIPHVAAKMEQPPGPPPPSQGPDMGPKAAKEQPPTTPHEPPDIHEEQPRGPTPPGPPPSTPSQPSPLPSGAPGAAASTIPTPEPGGRPYQPKIGPAPKSTDHELPAIKQGVDSAAATMGSIAAMAASLGMGGLGGGASGAMIAGAFKQGGKIVNSAINVASSALVGTITPGTTENPYGVGIKGLQAPNNLGPAVDNSTHYHGDLYSQDMDDFFRRQELRDNQNMQTQLAARGNI